MGCGASTVAAAPPVATSPNKSSAAAALHKRSGATAAAAAAAAAQPVVLRPASACGVSLRLLRAFHGRFVEGRGDLTTSDVVETIVKPHTRDRQCRFVDLVEQLGLGTQAQDVGVPQYFISHAWRNSFGHLVRQVCGQLSNADSGSRVWVDCFAINQHQASKEELDQFAVVIQEHASATLVSLPPAEAIAANAACNPMARIWCLHELDRTLRSNPDKLVIMDPGYSPEALSNLFHRIDASKAEAFSAADRQRIHAEIVEQHGSLERFSMSLKLRLLLQPLSYTVDVRMLNARSGGDDQHDWRLLDAWLAAGRGSDTNNYSTLPPPPRVLCIKAGAGTGKSSISAALCSRQSGGPGAPVSAFHFFKYSDQRRLDGVLVVRSLAYQLALRHPPLQAYYDGLGAAQVAHLSRLDAAFDTLLLQPLTKLREQLGPIVILLDALDEADPPELQFEHWDSDASITAEVDADCGTSCSTAAAGSAAAVMPCGNKAQQLIHNHLSRLPGNVRFICTTRPNALRGFLLPSLRRTFSGMLELEPGQLKHPDADAAPAEDGGAGGDALNAAAGGGTMSGVMMFDTVAALLPPGALEPLGRPPQLQDVRDAYAKIFALQQKGVGAKGWARVAQLLQVLMAAQEPLPASLLQQMGLRDVRLQLPGYSDDPLQRTGLFYEAEHRVYLLHKSLADWLLDCSPAAAAATANTTADAGGSGAAQLNSYHVDTAAGHRQLGEFLRTQVKPGSPFLAYSLKYLPTHLARAGPSAGPLLDELLLDYDFVEAAFRAKHGHRLINALGGMRHGTALSRDVLRWLMAFQHVMAAAPEEVLTTALRCPLDSAVFKAANERARRQGHAGWETVRAMAWQSWPAHQVTLSGHTNSCNGCAFSPDGRHLASVSADKTLRLWASSTGKCLASLHVHANYATGVQFSPDGARLATCGWDKKVCMLDAATGQVTSTLAGHGDLVNCVCWSGDGEAVASGSNDKTVRVWRGSAAAATGAAASADGSRAAAAAAVNAPSSSSSADTAFAATASADVVSMLQHDDRVTCCQFDPTSPSRLAACGEDQTLRIWDLSSTPAKCALTIKHDGPVTAVAVAPALAWTPDGTAILFCGFDNLVYLYDCASGKCSAKLEGSYREVTCLAVSRDGCRLAAGSADKMVRVYDLAAVRSSKGGGGGGSGGGGLLAALQGHQSNVSGVAFSADGSQLASSSIDGTVRLWQLPPGGSSGGGKTAAAAAPAQCHVGRVSAVATSPDGRRLYSASYDRTVRVWDSATGACVAVIETQHGNRIECMAVSPDGRVLATGSWDETIRLFDAATGKRLKTLEGHSSSVNSLAFYTDAHLVSASADNTLRVWDVTGGASISTVEGHQYTVTSVAVCKNGKLALSASEDRSVRLWHAPSLLHGSPKCVAALEKAHDYEVTAAVFLDDDGRRFASASSEGTIKIWEVTSQGDDASDSYKAACVATLRQAGGQQQGQSDKRGSAVLALAVAAEGGTIFTASGDNAICAWDIKQHPTDNLNSQLLPSFKCMAKLEGHAELVASLAALPDGRLVSGSDDCTLRIWQRR